MSDIILHNCPIIGIVPEDKVWLFEVNGFHCDVIHCKKNENLRHIQFEQQTAEIAHKKHVGAIVLESRTAIVRWLKMQQDLSTESK